MQGVRSKPWRPALVGRRCNRLGYVAAMRERQPRGQLAGRFLWGLAIKRHHRGGQTRFPRQLGTPPVADGHHFDVVRTPADGFFEMVNDHLSGGPTGCVNAWFQPDVRPVEGVGDFTRSSCSIKRREARRRRPQSEFWLIVVDPGKEKCALSGCAQDFHGTSTSFPQAGPGAVAVIPAGAGM